MPKRRPTPPQMRTNAAADKVPPRVPPNPPVPPGPLKQPYQTPAALAALGRALGTDGARLVRELKPKVAHGRILLSAAAAKLRKRVVQHNWQHPLLPSRQARQSTLPPAPVQSASAKIETVRKRLPGRLQLAGIAATLFLLLIGGTIYWALQDIPLDKVVSGTTQPIIVLEAANGEALVQQGPFQLIAAGLEEYPNDLVHAVLSIEDRRFYSHWGVDLWGIIRAVSRNLFAGQVVEGGSTITQQLVKVLHLDSERTLRRKIQEAFLSLWLESQLSKDEILTRYLNSVYMGAGATGMPAAARIYFDKAVGELTLSESAMLAGLIAAPSALNPLENLESARARADLVLSAMGEAGYLTPEEIAAAKANSAELRPRQPQWGAGTWFADWALQEAREIAGPFRGGIRVTTTLEPDLQDLAERTIAELLDEDAKAKGASQAALVALAPNGAVLAMVGGTDYAQSQFNRAVLAQRQPGSTFKLFVYYAALRAGLEPHYPVMDEPVDIDGWKPENFDSRFYGRVSIAEAFALSLNAATVNLGVEVGLDEVVAAARDLGIDAPLVETPSLFLGASEVSLLEMTGAYASVRAGVAPIEPWAIRTFETEGGTPFRIGPRVPPERSLEAYHSELVGLLKLVVDQGTGQAAQLDGFAAGKTGTSQSYRDAWFIGFNEDLTVGIWVGNDEGKPMEEVTGGQLPAQIFQRFMSDAMGRPSSALVSGRNPAVQSSAAEPSQCNVRACSRAYRSFRASDCTFQPYGGGPRKVCER